MKNTSRVETISTSMGFKERIEKSEEQVDKIDELYEKVCGEDEINPEKMKEIRRKIGKQEEPESEEDLVTMNKVFAEDAFLTLLENVSEEEFEIYKEHFQTELNIAMIQHIQGEDVSEKIKRLRNRFVLIEIAKQYRGAIF